MSESESALACPKCHSANVRRSRRANAAEMVRMMLGIYPFRCTNCGERFWANVFLFNSWRWAKCPRCLNLNLTDWPKRHYHRNTWADFLTSIGAQKHRCSRCRHNFISFRSRLPAHQGAKAEADDLDFDDERPVPVKPSESKSPEPQPHDSAAETNPRP